MLKINRLSLVACLGFIATSSCATGTSLDRTGLLATMEESAPSFAMLWDLVAADIRSEADLASLLERYDAFADYQDHAHFRATTLRHMVETGQPLPNFATDLVGYSVDPDRYLLNDYKSGTHQADPLITLGGGCSISTERRMHEDGLGPVWILIRSCTTDISVYSQSEATANKVSEDWLDQTLALGAVLAAQPAPESWQLLYDPVVGDPSPTPTRDLYKMTFQSPNWQHPTGPLGLPLGDGGARLSAFKIEYSRPSYSDVYNGYANTIYARIEVEIPISDGQLTSIEAGRYFSIDD